MIADSFREQFGSEPLVVASAPGRVNLIGEHTDYNEGFVLPMAIDRRVFVALAPRDDLHISAWSERFAERREVDLGRGITAGSHCWEDYVSAVVRTMRDAGMPVRGVDVAISAGVAAGAGLSSSAALETALVRALAATFGIPWNALEAAQVARRAENLYVGVQCGIMDPLVSACGRSGHALLLDCRSMDVTHVPLPTEIAIVVMDTGVRRSLSASEYNERRASCERAVAVLRARYPDVQALRDATAAQLDSVAESMDDLTLRRARHVIGEMNRPAAMRDALLAGEFEQAGALMDASHQSLRDLYEVSSTHLDAICDAARSHPSCYGARLTGAGFGGCAIALVRAGAVDAFIAHAKPRYEAATYKRSEFFVVSADGGAGISFAS